MHVKRSNSANACRMTLRLGSSGKGTPWLIPQPSPHVPWKSACGVGTELQIIPTWSVKKGQHDCVRGRQLDSRQTLAVGRWIGHVAWNIWSQNGSVSTQTYLPISSFRTLTLPAPGPQNKRALDLSVFVYFVSSFVTFCFVSHMSEVMWFLSFSI